MLLNHLNIVISTSIFFYQSFSYTRRLHQAIVHPQPSLTRVGCEATKTLVDMRHKRSEQIKEKNTSIFLWTLVEPLITSKSEGLRVDMIKVLDI